MKKGYIFVILLFPLIVNAQLRDSVSHLVDGPGCSMVELEIYPFAILSSQPLFPGGVKAMKKWCTKHTFYTHREAKSNSIGKIYCEATIDTTGKISDPKIVRPIGRPVNDWLENEVIRLISSMPRFEPGKYGDKIVNVRYLFTFLFRQDSVNISQDQANSGNTILIYPLKNQKQSKISK